MFKWRCTKLCRIILFYTYSVTNLLVENKALLYQVAPEKFNLFVTFGPSLCCRNPERSETTGVAALSILTKIQINKKTLSSRSYLSMTPPHPWSGTFHSPSEAVRMSSWVYHWQTSPLPEAWWWRGIQSSSHSITGGHRLEGQPTAASTSLMSHQGRPCLF